MGISFGPMRISGFTAVIDSPPNYIEDMFSSYLYTGNGTSQTINNGIDLSGKGGLTWLKWRTGQIAPHALFDTARGATKVIWSNESSAQYTWDTGLTNFNANGFTLDSNANINDSTYPSTYVSWTFRKQAKFFDIVTYTGNGASVRNIAHNLGSVPGCIIVKTTSAAYNWYVYHQSTGNAQALILNSTAAAAGTGAWNSTTPTSSVFTVDNTSEVNENGQTYVAYIFASNAGGFGAAGTDNVITCGSFTTDSGGLLTAPISLGYEPQWVMYKRTDGTSNWSIVDTMRGFINSSNSDSALKANDSAAEAFAGLGAPSATGIVNDAATNGFVGSSTYIYIAIRRGPMKTPTDATTVFNVTNSNTGGFITTNFPVDSLWQGWKGGSIINASTSDRLRGVSTKTGTIQTGPTLSTSQTTAETNYSTTQNWNNIGFTNADAGNNTCQWAFGRAPGFFDEVCYTGNGSSLSSLSHSLGSTPEFIIVKKISASGNNWGIYHKDLPALGRIVYLNLTFTDSDGYTGFTPPTSSIFYVGGGGSGISGGTATSNENGATYVAYLFATLAGVSKVGTYTGTGTLQTINCGFASGARFLLIKRTDSTGDWYVWDSARGMTSGNDPYLLLNSSAAEVTNTNYVDTDTTGFKVTAAAPAAINASGGTYIFLAIA